MKHPVDNFLLTDIAPFLSEGIILTDGNGFIQSTNNAVLSFFPAIVLSDLRGKKITDLIHSKDLTLFFANKQEMHAITMSIGMHQVRGDFRMLRDDTALLLLKNITSLQQMTAELAEAEKQMRLFQTILDKVDEGICYIDNNQKIIFYNQKMGELDSKEAIGVRYKIYTTIFKDTNYKTDALLNALTLERPVVLNESFFSRTGKRFFVNKVTEPLYLGNQKIGALCTAKDFTKTEQVLNSISEPQNHDERAPIPKEANDQHSPFAVHTSSKIMKKVVKDAELAAAGKIHTLIWGENGSGKSHIAEFIKRQTDPALPFFSLNCAAVPASLLEKTLFGSSERKGILELANGGTLQLDQIDEMDPSLQSRLLVLLQQKKMVKHGEREEIPLSIRIVALLNIKPSTALKKRLLVEDLFYLLSSVTIAIPPIRSRKEDLPELTDSIIARKNADWRRNGCSISEEAMTQLKKYSFPGNVRQLEYILEGALALLGDGNIILPHHLPTYLTSTDTSEDIGSVDLEFSPSLDLTEQVERFEKELIVQTLHKTNCHITQAAEKLGISRQSLNYKIRKYEIGISRGDE